MLWEGGNSLSCGHRTKHINTHSVQTEALQILSPSALHTIATEIFIMNLLLEVLQVPRSVH
jgi:hypothetical protein